MTFADCISRAGRALSEGYDDEAREWVARASGETVPAPSPPPSPLITLDRRIQFLRDLDAGRVELEYPPPSGWVPIETVLSWLLDLRRDLGAAR